MTDAEYDELLKIATKFEHSRKDDDELILDSQEKLVVEDAIADVLLRNIDKRLSKFN
jgi:hypothetical protein